MKNDRDYRPIILFGIILFFILFVGLFTPVRDKISFRVENLKNRLYMLFNSPADTVFVPQGGEENISMLSQTAEGTHTPTITMTMTVPPTETAVIVTPAATATPTLNPTATITPTPLPESAHIDGVKYEDQHGIWNYCAPTNLSMALTFWGWKGNRLDAGKWLKPFDKDKNVMFYEMENFVAEQTQLRSIVRSGGTPELLKKLIAAGFPILIEKGSFMQEVSGAYSWMGHYNVITGYNDATQIWTVQDSYYKPNYEVTYETLYKEWKCFNFEFMIVYPGDKEAELYSLLGPYVNSDWAKQNAFEMANNQVAEAQDDESRFYAYFNRGTSQVALTDYYGAAQSYDMAFSYYANLDTKTRPYRIVWYQTGPYYAYYYSGRYQDVINLANITLASTNEPYLEESYYWRAMAEAALGEFESAQADVQSCLDIHPGFVACSSLSAEIGMGGS